MQKIALTAALFVLAALMGCGPTQAPEEPTPTATTTPTQTQPTSLALSPTAAAPTTPTEPPATEITPATTPPPTAEPEGEAQAGAIAPLLLDDPESVASELSDQELACLAQIADIGELLRIFSDPGIATSEKRTRLMGCLNDENVARIFLAGFVPDSGPLSLESSACIRAAFKELDPRAVMTAGLEGDAATAMAGSMTAFIVSLACLNREEWEAAAPRVGMNLDEQEGMVCVLEELGGPGEMAAAMIAANAGHAATLSAAAMECGLEMGVAPARPTATPMPTATTPSRLATAASETAETATGTAEPLLQETGPGDTGAVGNESGETPLPEGVSPALVQDARMYAEQFGVELHEAVTRLMLQEPAGKLGAALEEHEADTFAGLWIQHEPEFGIVVVFTRDGRQTVHQYIQDGPLEELVEVRHADATLRELMKAQAEAHEIVSRAGFQVASGINVFENRVELYADNRAQLEEAIEENGLALPGHVLIIGQ